MRCTVISENAELAYGSAREAFYLEEGGTHVAIAGGPRIRRLDVEPEKRDLAECWCALDSKRSPTGFDSCFSSIDPGHDTV